MKSHFWMSAAAGAIVAAATLGVADVAAQTSGDSGSDLIVLPAHVYNTDNGVHGAPSGRVEEAPLGRSQRVSARPVHIASVSPSSRVAGARLIALSASQAEPARPPAQPKSAKLPVQLAEAVPPPSSAEDAAAPAVALAPPVPAPVVVRTPAPAAATAPAALVQVYEENSKPGPQAAPRPAAAVVEMAKADVEPPPAAVDAADGPEDSPGPEESRAYNMAPPDAAPPAPEAPASPDHARQGATPLALADARQPALQQVDEPMRQRVAFPRHSAEAAAAFDRYMHEAAGIAPGMKGGTDVAQALKTASAYEPAQLEEGMIAFGAIAALQDARFVYAVMDAAAQPGSRRALVDELYSDPSSAGSLPGAGEARALASEAILREAKPLLSTGMALKQAAYDVQHQSWSLAKVDDGPGRLAQAKAASVERMTAGDGDMARLMSRITDARDDGSGVSSASRIADRSIALAALAILDGAEGGDSSRLGGLLSEASSAECLKMSKLNLFQCLSVAGPEYEDLYCLGQHAVLDTAKCVAGAAGSPDGVQLTAMAGGARLRSAALMSRAPR